MKQFLRLVDIKIHDEKNTALSMKVVAIIGIRGCLAD
jgi:hypothetical protein